MSKKSKNIKTTGTLNNFDFQAILVDVEVSNFDKDDDRKAKVQIFDWSTNSPKELEVVSFNGPNLTRGDGGPIKIKPMTSCSFLALLTGVFAYEVRVTLFETTEDVVVTSQGISPIGNGPNVVGQTVLNNDFKTIELD